MTNLDSSMQTGVQHTVTQLIIRIEPRGNSERRQSHDGSACGLCTGAGR